MAHDFDQATHQATARVRMRLLQELVAQRVLIEVTATNERRPRYTVNYLTHDGIQYLTLVGDSVDHFVHGARAVQAHWAREIEPPPAIVREADGPHDYESPREVLNPGNYTECRVCGAPRHKHTIGA